MAEKLSVEPQKLLATLKATVFKGASDEELLALVVISNQYGLSPLLKEIYAFPAKGGGIVPVVSIDGWINRMNSNPQFDGIEFKDEFGEGGKPYSCTAIIHRKDRSHPVTVTEYYSECNRNTDPWNKCPSRMLRHRALMQGVRVAFGFGGVYDEDDAEVIAARGVRDVKPSADFAAPVPVKTVDEVESVDVPADMHELYEVMRLCGGPDGGYTLCKVLVERGEMSANETLGDLSDNQLQIIIDNWGIYEEAMAAKGKKGGKGK